MNEQFRPSLYPQFPQRVRRGIKRGALHFEEFAAIGNEFINDVAEELGCNRNTAARITRCVLHAVRDRLPADDAIQFAQGLPMALKAVFIDQYNISRVPIVIRSADEFLNFIYDKDGLSAPADFPDAASTEEALCGVFRVLEDYVDIGQIEQVKELMGHSIREMIDSGMRMSDYH